MRESNIGTELKEMAQEVVRFGERCVQAGREWLNERREDMNNRNDEGRRDHRSGQGHEHGGTQRQSRYSRSAQSDYEEQADRSGSGRSYSRDRGEYYGGSQFAERTQGSRSPASGWDEDRGNWDYEGGPERFGGSGYSESAQGHRRGQQTSQSQWRDYGSGSGDYYSGRQGYGAQESFGSEYSTSGRGQGYGESSGYSRQQEGSSSMRGQPRSQYSRQFGSEQPGRSSQDYLDEGEMSGYGGRELSSQQYASSSSGRYGTEPGQYGYGGYGTSRRSFRGVGPKNYTRSDERLTEEINERLTDDDDLDASEISVRVMEGRVTLEGIVDQRWMKHRAEDIADACNGVKEVDNRIQVTSASSRLGQGAQQATGRSTARTSTTTSGSTATGSTTGSTTGTSTTTGTGGTTPH